MSIFRHGITIGCHNKNVVSATTTFLNFYINIFKILNDKIMHHKHKTKNWKDSA